LRDVSKLVRKSKHLSGLTVRTIYKHEGREIIHKYKAAEFFHV